MKQSPRLAGTQGDPWDSQWDMFLALVGSLAAQLALSRVHDRQLGETAPGSAEFTGA